MLVSVPVVRGVCVPDVVNVSLRLVVASAVILDEGEDGIRDVVEVTDTVVVGLLEGVDLVDRDLVVDLDGVDVFVVVRVPVTDRVPVVVRDGVFVIDAVTEGVTVIRAVGTVVTELVCDPVDV